MIIQALQLILALSFLVMIHELGHYVMARLCGVRVEKFYMFFNPWISLVQCKKFDGAWHVRFLHRPEEDDEWDKHPENTEWGLGWLPFGGYCAIAGMVDETKSAEDLGSEPQPWEFRSKSVFQRMCIIIGGILVNFVAALLIFGILKVHYGDQSLPLRNLPNGLYYSEELLQEGFRQGDRILTIDGTEPEELGNVINALVIEKKRAVEVLRTNGDTVMLTMSEDLGNRYLAAQNEFDRIERDKARADKQYQKQHYIFMAEAFPFVIDSVLPQSSADMMGMIKGDSVVGVNGKETRSFFEVQNVLKMHPCDSVLIEYYRNGERQYAKAFIGDECKLGVMCKMDILLGCVETKHYGFFEGMYAGVQQGMSFLGNYVRQFRLVFSKEGAQSVGGFGAIGSMYSKVWNWRAFWSMTALLSLILAFMNFLPIPALDGGYILFLLVEAITRKKPSDTFLEKANSVGFWILIILMVFANGNDILKIFF